MAHSSIADNSYPDGTPLLSCTLSPSSVSVRCVADVLMVAVDWGWSGAAENDVSHCNLIKGINAPGI